VAILDWVMPGLPGTEICRRLRARADGVPPHLILVTSRERTEDIVTGLEAGADDYLAKPFMPEELRARVRVGVRVWTLQQRLAAQVEELQAALAHVNRLQGLLPICAYCKKIRNEQNYWQQVEGYIADNSDATFTHGICPDCEEKVREEIRRLTAERRAMGTAP
jgi:DNA-binding response OmpR family regulator